MLPTVSSISSGLRSEFGDIDIYLFDQLLRGRLDRRGRILDAGCGSGRNLPYLLMHGFDVFAIDRDAAAVTSVERLMARLKPSWSGDHVRQGEVDALPWTDACMDAVLSSAVLHFARDLAHFRAMILEMWRVLAPGGLLFARLATSIGLEGRIPMTVGRVLLPDGSERFVVDEATILRIADELGGRLLDPLKTTNVQNLRAMTTWVMEKSRQSVGHDEGG